MQDILASPGDSHYARANVHKGCTDGQKIPAITHLSTLFFSCHVPLSKADHLPMTHYGI